MKNQASRKGSGAGLDSGSVCWIGTRLQEASGLKNVKNKIGKRKSNRKLVLQWTQETEFAVPVTVRSRTQPRILKNSTISIQLRSSALKPSAPA